VTHTEDYPRALAARGVYRIEPSPSGGWDVWLDPPANPLEGLASPGGPPEGPSDERRGGHTMNDERAARFRFVDIEQQHDGWWAIGYSYYWDDGRAGVHCGPYATREDAERQAAQIGPERASDERASDERPADSL